MTRDAVGIHQTLPFFFREKKYSCFQSVLLQVISFQGAKVDVALSSVCRGLSRTYFDHRDGFSHYVRKKRKCCGLLSCQFKKKSDTAAK